MAVGDKLFVIPIDPFSLEADSGIQAKAWAGARPKATQTAREVMRVTWPPVVKRLPFRTVCTEPSGFVRLASIRSLMPVIDRILGRRRVSRPVGMEPLPIRAPGARTLWIWARNWAILRSCFKITVSVRNRISVLRVLSFGAGVPA
nr:hypothetical protein [Acidiferrobacter sp.]